MTEDKRRFSRIHFNVAARLTVDGREYEVDKIINLSVGGCQVETAAAINVGGLCTFSLLLDGLEGGVNILGEAVRCEGREISLNFTQIDPENLFHLQNVIRYNAEDPDSIEEEISRHPGLK